MLVVITCISWPRGRYPKILSLYWCTRSPKPRPHRPMSPVTQTLTRTPRARGRRGEARATCQSISDCSPRPCQTGLNRFKPASSRQSHDSSSNVLVPHRLQRRIDAFSTTTDTTAWRFVAVPWYRFFPRLALVLNYIPRPLCLSKVAPSVCVPASPWLLG